MAILQRYSRSLAPSDPKSVPDYLDREHQKLEMTLDAIHKDASDRETLVTAAQTAISTLQSHQTTDEASITALQAFVNNIQASIANDASGAANQATVNAILTALRAYKIISP